MRVFKSLVIAVSAVSVLGFASASNAEVFSLTSPSVTGGSVTFNSVGTVNLQQTASINCNIVVGGGVVGSPGSDFMSSVSATITPAFPSCGWPVVYTIGTWTIQAIDHTTGEVKIHMEANTIAGDPCRGDATLYLESDKRTIILDNVTLPADSGRPAYTCYINGVIAADKDVYILP